MARIVLRFGLILGIICAMTCSIDSRSARLKRFVTAVALAVTATVSAYVAEVPSAVHKTDKGWAFVYAMPKPEEVNYLKVELRGEAAKWSLFINDGEALRGEALAGRHEEDLPKECAAQYARLEVESSERPSVVRFELTHVPFADAIDPKLLKVTNRTDKDVFIDFGRDTALRSFAYDGEWTTNFLFWGSASADIVNGDWGNIGENYVTVERQGDKTVVKLHNVMRNRYFRLLSKDRPLDAKKLTFDVVPYGYTKHLTDETWSEKLKRLEWWTEARFGMFIHFGLYSVPGRHEWVKTLEQIGEEKYDVYFENFNPVRFDAKEWAKAAKDAGMKYVVLTSKHHEGFCLWDSAYTDYKITNTPFKRDLIKEFVEAFRAEGLKVGFYYSLLDWHHPDFALDSCHPRRKGALWNADDDYTEANRTRDMAKYRQYMKDQVRELLTKYGKIDFIWFDFSYPKPNGKGKGSEDWDSEGLVRLVKSINPDIIIDNRLDLPDYEDGWDFATPEQCREPFWVKVHGRRVPWETCQTFSGSWGYHRDELEWKSGFQVIGQLIETVSKGGNVIMNVGPTGAGEFDARARARLADYGEWLRVNGESIYGCTQAPEEFVAPNGTVLTYNPKTNRLYMHLLSWQWGAMPVPFLRQVRYAQFLHDKSEIRFRNGALQMPTAKPPVEIPVVEFMLKE